jgi:hypothetical protein
MLIERAKCASRIRALRPLLIRLLPLPEKLQRSGPPVLQTAPEAAENLIM